MRADGREYELIGGCLCLDFANTLHRYGAEDPGEELTSYSALLSWSQAAGIIRGGEARRLARAARRAPAKAGTALKQARNLRNLTCRVFFAVASGEAPAPADLAAMNAALARALAHAQVVRQGRGFAWAWKREDSGLGQLLWPVLRSAGELLTSPKLSRVRQCSSPTCTWLFLDVSKNGRRRWCEMRVCGNRAKARRNYQRRKATRLPRTARPQRASGRG